MKGEMSRARSRLNLHKGLSVCGQLSFYRVKAVNHDLICSKIARVCIAIATIKQNRMSVRPLLTIRVYAGAVMVIHICGPAQTHIALDGQDGNISSHIIGNQNESGAAVNSDVAGGASK